MSPACLAGGSGFVCTCLYLGRAAYDQGMAPTVHDLIRTAVQAAQRQTDAQTATKTAVAQIAAQRGATGPAMAYSAGTPEAAPQ